MDNRRIEESSQRERSGQEGQAATELVFLLLFVLGAYFSIVNWMTRSGFTELLLKPLTGTFAATYRYGKPTAKGFEDGGPVDHPRAGQSVGSGNFRIFFNQAGQSG